MLRLMNKINTTVRRLPWATRSITQTTDPIEVYTAIARVTDILAGFYTMVETVQDKNHNWTMDNIILQWWKIAFKEVPKVISIPHNIIQISSQLFLNGCQRYKILPDRGFMRLHKVIQSPNFLNLKHDRVMVIAKSLSEFTILEHKI